MVWCNKEWEWEDKRLRRLRNKILCYLETLSSRVKKEDSAIYLSLHLQEVSGDMLKFADDADWGNVRRPKIHRLQQERT